MKFLAIVLLLVAGSLSHAVPLDVGQDAPCITLPQVDKAGNKSNQSTCASNPTGRKVVVEFFATWCGYCVNNLPVFEKLAKDHSDKADFRILGLDNTTAPLEQFFAGRAMDGYSVAFDPQNLSSDAFAIRGTPSIYVLGTDGKIVLFHEGTMETAEEIKTVEDAIVQ